MANVRDLSPLPPGAATRSLRVENTAQKQCFHPKSVNHSGPETL
jgi:hypothetical protein